MALSNLFSYCMGQSGYLSFLNFTNYIDLLPYCRRARWTPNKKKAIARRFEKEPYLRGHGGAKKLLEDLIKDHPEIEWGGISSQNITSWFDNARRKTINASKQSKLDRPSMASKIDALISSGKKLIALYAMFCFMQLLGSYLQLTLKLSI